MLEEPLSFWGGVDPATGEIIDIRHPQRGANVAGRVLVMALGRGSSSSSSVLAEAIRAGTAPAAIVLTEPDPILATGLIVARELYGRTIPLVMASAAALRTGEAVVVRADSSSADLAAERSSGMFGLHPPVWR